MPIIVREYEEISETNLDNCDLDKLQCYLKRNKLDKALKVTRHGIKAKSWVGVIKFKNTHIQILPKLICSDDNKKNILKNLILMLYNFS